MTKLVAFSNQKHFQKYKSCIHTTNKNKEYICLLTAILSLQIALDENIEDFYISVFNKKWFSYGYIVIDILKNGDLERKFAIKCKPVPNNEIKICSFRDIITIKKESERVKALLQHHGSVKTTFAIFTTFQAPMKKDLSPDEEQSELESVQPVKEKELLLIDVSNKDGAVFEIPIEDGHKILIFTSQNIGQNRIQGQLEEKFKNYPHISYASKEFITYMKNWCKGCLGGFYSLRKIDVILNLGYILLQDVIMDPITPIVSNKKNTSTDTSSTVPSDTGNDTTSYKMWNNVIDKMDLTILKKDLCNVSRISTPIIEFVNKTFDTIIETGRLLHVKTETVKALDPEIKAYLLEATQNLEYPLPSREVYSALWKANRIPLLLNHKVGSEDFIVNIICFMKQNHFKRKFIIFSDDPSSMTVKNDFKMFRSICDILVYINLWEINVKLADGIDITLGEICSSNLFLLRSITPEKFLSLTLGKCSFEEAADNDFVRGSDCLQLIIHDKEIWRKIYKPKSTQKELNHPYFQKIKVNNPALLNTNIIM